MMTTHGYRYTTFGRSERYHNATGIGREIIRLYLHLNGGKSGGIVGESARYALKMARAKVRADAVATFLWEADFDGCSGCMCGSKRCKCHARKPHDTEWCRLVIPCEDHGTDCKHARTVASLSGICEADDSYRRLVECELALEAIDAIEDEHTRIDANEDADTIG